ncbi:hypothetical protein Sjap_003602 [Stephania japonica]|uniref:F-box domain-containing protein n=1 Tax=Stephania japonica TaxID=461633 RepID=A0AAP0KR56_9MAGN
MADGGQSDRLSDLPDSILHHIFSFIDTRYAVRASVLSSRWRHLWKSLSYLYFDWETKQPKKIAATADLVNMVLSFRDRESDIQCFRLQSVSSKNFRLVYSWILNAIRHNVRVIDIDYEYVSHPIEWPHSLFSYNSLTTLKLSSIYQLFVLPDSISLPNLKVLHLEDVDFADIKTGSCVSNLITSCPSLEALEVSCMNLGFGDKFVISAPKLERLVIYDNVKPFMKEMKKFEMKICAPNLRTFRCKDRILNEYSMGELRFLDSASIDMVMVKGCYIEPFKILDNLLKDKKWEYVQHLAGLLKAVCGAKSLCLKLSALLIVVCVCLSWIECTRFLISTLSVISIGASVAFSLFIQPSLIIDLLKRMQLPVN